MRNATILTAVFLSGAAMPLSAQQSPRPVRGATWYARPGGLSLYVTPSVVWSLQRRWKSGALTEGGVRVSGQSPLMLRVGVGVLTTTDGEVRVNPTIGLGLRLRGGR